MEKELDKLLIKKLYKRKLELEKKLTEKEIDYNKIDFIYKKYKKKIKIIEKEISDSEEKNLKKKIDKKIKIEEKIELFTKNSQEKIEKEENIKIKKNIENGLKISLKEMKKEILLLDKKIKYLKNLNINNLKVKIETIKSKINNIQIEHDNKKDIANNVLNEYNNFLIEWENAMPNIDKNVSISVKNLNVWYGTKQSLFDINIDLPKNQVIAIIGPSGCGKSTFLKTLNRINDEIPVFKAEGIILLDNQIDILKLKNIYNSDEKLTLPELRTRIGMVFQQPNPFPMSIFNNVAYGPKINGIKNKVILKEIVNDSLKKSALFEQVKDNLDKLATGLSGGQQQRLCIARAIANGPEILLMDEPTSALDPLAAAKIEDLIFELREYYTIIMVTHSMQQASRISDKTAFFYQGKLIEYGDTKQIFTNPKNKKTEDYIRGRFG